MDHDHIEVAELRVLIHWLCIRHMALEQSNSKVYCYYFFFPNALTPIFVLAAHTIAATLCSCYSLLWHPCFCCYCCCC